MEIAAKSTSTIDDSRLTKYQKWHLIILSAALILSIITVVRVGQQVGNLAYQTKRNTEALALQKRSVEAQTWQMITQQMVQINRLFIEHPDLYPYFNDKKGIQKDESIYPKVIAMADMLLDFMDTFEDDYVRSLPHMQDNEKFWTAWQNYFEDQFRISPALCNRFNEIRSWYTENGAVAKFAEKGCANVDGELTGAQ